MTEFTESCLVQASANTDKACVTVAVSTLALSKDTNGCCFRSNVRNISQLSRPERP